MAEHKPDPTNVPGAFYVEDDCCTMCGVPFAEAPELFGAHQDPNGYSLCFVKRQPENSEELDHMIMAIRCAELMCIRYRGDDRQLQEKLVELGEGMVCDNLPRDLQERAEQLELARKQREREQSPGS
jgi:hypothetical protein